MGASKEDRGETFLTRPRQESGGVGVYPFPEGLFHQEGAAASNELPPNSAPASAEAFTYRISSYPQNSPVGIPQMNNELGVMGNPLDAALMGWWRGVGGENPDSPPTRASRSVRAGKGGRRRELPKVFFPSSQREMNATSIQINASKLSSGKTYTQFLLGP